MLRSYVQEVVTTEASPSDAAALVASAFMSIRKPTTRKVPDISAKNAGTPGNVILAAKSLGPSVVYSWEHSLDQAKWEPIPDTMKARTEVSGLTSHSVHYFRFSTFTRAGPLRFSFPCSPARAAGPATQSALERATAFVQDAHSVSAPVRRGGS